MFDFHPHRLILRRRFIALPRMSAGILEEIGGFRPADGPAKELRLALLGMVEVRTHGTGGQPKIETDPVLVAVGGQGRLYREACDLVPIPGLGQGIKFAFVERPRRRVLGSSSSRSGIFVFVFIPVPWTAWFLRFGRTIITTALVTTCRVIIIVIGCGAFHRRIRHNYF